MTTLSEYRSTIRSLGNFPANDVRITDAVINREVNRAIRRIANKRDWWWLLKERTLITAAGQRDYASPRDMKRVVSIRHTDNQSEPNLYVRTRQELDQYTATGRPLLYAVWGGRIFLANTPDSAYTLGLAYVCLEPTLSADTDVPLLPEQYDDGVLSAALVELYKMTQRLDEAQTSSDRYNEWLEDVEGQNNQTRDVPRIRARRDLGY